MMILSFSSPFVAQPISPRVEMLPAEPRVLSEASLLIHAFERWRELPPDREKEVLAVQKQCGN
jgi:hypothetical protein